jgi:16S rRNA A1518/A1519 N6-dimethyltransferase RsmA/KsgA/DIM1 with predicted DNA glycosylase/AP lyase activity
VSDSHGDRLQGASITIEQISKDFPFGSAIARTILGNLPYQVSSVHVIVLQLQKIGNQINRKEY